MRRGSGGRGRSRRQVPEPCQRPMAARRNLAPAYHAASRVSARCSGDRAPRPKQRRGRARRWRSSSPRSRSGSRATCVARRDGASGAPRGRRHGPHRSADPASPERLQGSSKLQGRGNEPYGHARKRAVVGVARMRSMLGRVVKSVTEPLPRGQAARCRGTISLRLIRLSAICTAFKAAPLRRLSDTHQKLRPLSTVGSSRMREI